LIIIGYVFKVNKGLDGDCAGGGGNQVMQQERYLFYRVRTRFDSSIMVWQEKNLELLICLPVFHWRKS
jgi:hypothetical protein